VLRPAWLTISRHAPFPIPPLELPPGKLSPPSPARALKRRRRFSFGPEFSSTSRFPPPSIAPNIARTQFPPPPSFPFSSFLSRARDVSSVVRASQVPSLFAQNVLLESPPPPPLAKPCHLQVGSALFFSVFSSFQVDTRRIRTPIPLSLISSPLCNFLPFLWFFLVACFCQEALATRFSFFRCRPFMRRVRSRRSLLSLGASSFRGFPPTLNGALTAWPVGPRRFFPLDFHGLCLVAEKWCLASSPLFSENGLRSFFSAFFFSFLEIEIVAFPVSSDLYVIHR